MCLVRRYLRLSNVANSYERELNELLRIAETDSDLEYVQSLITAWEKTNTSGFMITSESVGQALGVTDRTVRRWWARGCPRDSMEAIAEWRAENIKAVAEDAEPTEIQIEVRRAELMDKMESARTRRLKNDQMEGRLVEWEEVERATAVNISRFTNGLASIGTMVANVCPSEIKVVIREQVDQIIRMRLKELADSMRVQVDE